MRVTDIILMVTVVAFVCVSGYIVQKFAEIDAMYDDEGQLRE